MVQRNEVVGDIGQIAGIELELAGDDVAARRPLIGGVDIAGEVAGLVVDGEFAAILPPGLIVERRQDDRRAELAFVDQVVRRLVEAVEAERELLRSASARRRHRNSRRVRPWAWCRCGRLAAVVLSNSAISVVATSSIGGGEK